MFPMVRSLSSRSVMRFSVWMQLCICCMLCDTILHITYVYPPGLLHCNSSTTLDFFTYLPPVLYWAGTELNIISVLFLWYFRRGSTTPTLPRIPHAPADNNTSSSANSNNRRRPNSSNAVGNRRTSSTEKKVQRENSKPVGYCFGLKDYVRHEWILLKANKCN